MQDGNYARMGIAVLIVHGITAECVGYSKNLRKRIIAGLPRRMRHEVQFFEVFWANRLRQQQNHYVQRAAELARLKVGPFRKIAIRGLGDAAAYQKGGASVRDTAYLQVQEELSQAMRSLDDPDRPLRPLILVGHSLGCHILSTFVWDTARLREVTPDRAAEPNFKEFRYVWEELTSETCSPFRRLETLAGIVTFGNNMPLFAFNLAPDKIVPITKARYSGEPLFPGRSLSPAQRSVARWINSYDVRDPLGYPLRPLNTDYENDLIEDKKITNWTAITPFGAHRAYWGNWTIARSAARLIRKILHAEPQVNADRQPTPTSAPATVEK